MRSRRIKLCVAITIMAFTSIYVCSALAKSNPHSNRNSWNTFQTNSLLNFNLDYSSHKLPYSGFPFLGSPFMSVFSGINSGTYFGMSSGTVIGMGGPGGGMGGPGGGMGGPGPGGSSPMGGPTRRNGERGGGRPSAGRRGDFWPLPDERVEQLLQDLEKEDPNKVKELREMQNSNPELFSREMYNLNRADFERINRQTIEDIRREEEKEFIAWLEEYFPSEVDDLKNTSQNLGDPGLYIMQYNQLSRKYRQLYDMCRRNPDQAEVFVANYKLIQKRYELVPKIKETTDEKQKEVLKGELKDILRDQYFLMIRIQQIELDRLLKQAQDLQDEIEQSQALIIRMQESEAIKKNVDSQMDYLLDPNRPTQTFGIQWGGGRRSR